MEQTPLPPLVSDALIAMGFDTDSPRALTPYAVKAIYEAERQRAREVVQALVDRLHFEHKAIRVRCGKQSCDQCDKTAATLALAKSQLNIEPTKP